jgi:hypothetical protein
VLAIILLAIVIIIFGKIKLAPGLALYGKPARLYGGTLLILYYPLQWLILFIYSSFPTQIIQDRSLIYIRDFVVVFAFLAIVMLPFKKLKGVEADQVQSEIQIEMNQKRFATRRKILIYFLLSGIFSAGAITCEIIFYDELKNYFTAISMVSGFSLMACVVSFYLLIKSFFYKEV